MNNIPRQKKPNPEQVRRFKSLVAGIVQCCRDRTTLESRRFTLPQAELRCLLLFRGERYLTATNMASELEVGKSRVTKLVGGLIDKGLVETVGDPKDGRVKLLGLTKAGRGKLEEIEVFVTGAHRRVLEQMEPGQQAMVMAALELLWSSMQTAEAGLEADENDSLYELNIR